MENHYPDIDEEVFIGMIRSCAKIDSTTERKVGTSYTFLRIGTSPMHKRMITLRAIDGTFSFYQATNKAILLGLIPELLEWWEENRNWKDGGYFDPEQ